MARTGHNSQRWQLRYRTFGVPRLGFSPDDCLDASAGDTDLGRFAVADGASEGGPDSGRWARLLVEEFVRLPESQDIWPITLTPLQARWQAEVGHGLPEPELPWYVAEHARARHHDAFATFIGLVMEAARGPHTPWRWQALAVGDSCLFQVRSGVLIERFPLANSQEFNTTPWLVSSSTSAEELRGVRGRTCAGESWPSDRVWLMTDALAEWFLLRFELDEKPWLELEQFLSDAITPEDFGEWVGGLRRSGKLRNDDVTLAAIWLE